MTYAVTLDVPAPIEAYDVVHRAMLARSGGTTTGLLVHLARATEGGFQVIEVWTSREEFERCSREVVGPVVAEVLQGRPSLPQRATEFAVRGLVVPPGGVTI